MTSKLFLSGEKLYLRPLMQEDIYGNYGVWFLNQKINQFNSHGRFPKTKQQLEEYIKELYNNITNLVLAMIDKETDKHIGNISLQDINYIDRCAELAIIIGENEYWNSGFGKEAAYLIISHGFTALNLHRIYLGTHERNIGMQKLAESLSFQLEGKRREAIYKDNQYGDIYEFGLLKRDWETFLTNRGGAFQQI